MLSLDNPSKTYTALAYLTGGGATTNYGIIVTIKNNILKYHKNIYWEYPQSNVSIVWCDDFNIKINNHTLNVIYDIYDYRHSQSNLDTNLAR